MNLFKNILAPYSTYFKVWNTQDYFEYKTISCDQTGQLNSAFY